MGLTISTNLSSLNAQNNLSTTRRAISKSFAQMASGNRITKAADDSAGLAIASNLGSQIRGYKQAQRNALDGMSMIQVAEGGLNETGNILGRMRELGIQASSDTIGDTERGFIDVEIQQLKQEMQRISQTTRFGDMSLLDGSQDKFSFQIGNNNDDFEDRIDFSSGEIVATTESLGVDDLEFTLKEGAQDSLEKVDDALVKINEFRSSLGAIQNRLSSTYENLGTTVENISSARSNIADTDLAETSAELTKNNIMLNASTSILAQANQQPAMALKLIG